MTRPRTPTRGPKASRVEPSEILDAAQAVFAQEGVRSASLRAIARRAGCDPALIYYHFASKEALFRAVVMRRFPAVLEDIQGIADAADPRPTVLRLWEVLLSYHRHLGRDPGLRALVRGEIVRGAEGLGHLLEDLVGPITAAVGRILAQGEARGEVRPGLQPLLATFFLLKLQLEILDVLPAVLGRLPGAPAGDPVALGMRAWIDLYWRGIARDPAAPLPPLPEPAA